ncbi:hypothetical protein LEP1GSC047_1222 [Leptospira inadai serovar Lyme str. 10]|uniref:7(1) septoil knot domain-containing protein n=2 Tax=Leptospira inadai serovar Lyme TaxID=293084 RepID=V6H7P6_9LEPT|nr:hypothetical protein LEP1GSC047_1222 [Leptospira inadai serovar Lyme str. 10]
MNRGGFMKRLILIGGLFLTLPVFSGEIYVTDGHLQSPDLKVYFTKSKSDADIVVYVTKHRYDAKGKDEIWYYTKHSSDANAKVSVTSSKSSADLIAYITKYKTDAGWKKSNRYRGRLN